jgi:hypothetical protein
MLLCLHNVPHELVCLYQIENNIVQKSKLKKL